MPGRLARRFARSLVAALASPRPAALVTGRVGANLCHELRPYAFKSITLSLSATLTSSAFWPNGLIR